MALRLTNTLTRKKEVFKPQDPQRVTMYLCGPTVYSYAHIGNFRPVVAFDVLYRLLRRIYGEGNVVYATNFTDVDDKIIAAANETGEPMAKITQKYAKAYEEDSAALNALSTGGKPQLAYDVLMLLQASLFEDASNPHHVMLGA